MPKTKKSDFQILADKRMREARVLLGVNEPDGAYYLAGYAVECALKSCIIKKLNVSDEWPERNFSDLCYRHELIVLLRLAELETAMNAEPGVLGNWGQVKEWRETSRYEHGKTATEVMSFLDAIDGPVDGVLTWIKSHW
jgi:hypothetical protein